MFIGKFNEVVSLKKCYLIYFIIAILTIFLLFNQGSFLNSFNALLLVVSSLVLGSFSIWYYYKNKDNLYKVAFVIIILFGILFLLIAPIDGPSDELEHLWRAEITSQGVLVPEPITINNVSGFESINSLATAPQDVTIYETNWDDLGLNTSMSLVNSAFLQNPFYLYIAQGIGVFLAKLLDMNNIWLLWFARFLNLLLYAGLSAIAIKKTPILKVPMFIVATFPIAIVQGASASADSFLISFSLVIMAYLLYIYKAKENSIGKREIVIFFILVLIVSMGRVSYGAFALLLFMVPVRNFKKKNYYYLSIAGVGVILAILLLWTQVFAMDSLLYSWRYETFIRNNVSFDGQIQYILSNPENVFVTFLLLPLELFNHIGHLSTFYIPYPSSMAFNIAYTIFFILIMFLYPVYEKFSAKSRIITLIVILLLIVGTYFIQFLTWSPVGSSSLSTAGVMPRYFIPIMVLLPFIFSFNKNQKIKNLNLIIVTAVISFLTVAIFFISTYTF